MNRYKTIKKSFKLTTDHNRKSGNDRWTCAYFEQLQEIEGDRPNITPDFTLASNGECSKRKLDNEENEKTEKKNLSTEPGTKEQNKKRSQERKSDVLLWLESYEERRTKREEEMMTRKEKMHVDTLEVMNRLIDKLLKCFLYQ